MGFLPYVGGEARAEGERRPLADRLPAPGALFRGFRFFLVWIVGTCLAVGVPESLALLGAFVASTHISLPVNVER